MIKLKKEKARKEAIKLRFRIKSYARIQRILKEEHDYEVSRKTIKRWWKRFNEGDWNLRDNSTRPNTIYHKFYAEDVNEIIRLRKKYGYSAYQLRKSLHEKDVAMSESMIKSIIKAVHLSYGSKIEGKRLKWVRFERDTPNSMWQLDGTTYKGLWLLPVLDDCSRYCVAIGVMNHMTTDNVIKLLEEAISMHGKPREILTDNGGEFRKEFDKWCKKHGIKHIRSGVHKPTTVGKVGRLQYTIVYELPYCYNDFEYFRWRYNCHRPHRSLNGLTPNQVYFGWKRHKKYKLERCEIIKGI